MQTTTLKAAAGLLLTSLHLAAAATAITAGTAEAVTIRACTGGTSGCDSISAVQHVAYGGSPGAYSSAATISVAGKGMAEGEVALSGVIGAPVLKARAESEAGYRTNTNSIALQRYTYIGATSTTRTFGGTLTYEQDVTGPFPFSGVGDGVLATIDIFQITDATVEVGSTAASNFNVLFSHAALAGYVSLASDQYRDAADNTSGLAMLEATVTLDPGDTIWVRVLLQTPAANAAFVDASHTLLTSWNNVTDLVPGAVAVPLPGTGALIGLAALAGCCTRRRAA